jgi:hypothetical protein
MWLTHKVKISTSSVAIGPCIHHYKNGSPSNLSAKRRIKGMGRRFRIWMMTHLGYDNPTSLQVSFPQKVSFTQITLQAVLRQSLRLPRNEPTLERPAAEHPLKGEPQPRVHRIPHGGDAPGLVAREEVRRRGRRPDPPRAVGLPPPQLRQLGDVGGDAPRLVAAEQLGGGARYGGNFFSEG